MNAINIRNCLLIVLSLCSALSAQASATPDRPHAVTPKIEIKIDRNYLVGVLNGGPFGLVLNSDGTFQTSPDIDPTKALIVSSTEDRRPVDGPLTIHFTDGSRLIQHSGYSKDGFRHIYYEDGPRGFRVELFVSAALDLNRKTK